MPVGRAEKTAERRSPTEKDLTDEEGLMETGGVRKTRIYS